MPTPKPGTAAGDLELATKSLVAGVESSAPSPREAGGAGETSLAGGSSGLGPTSTLGSRMSSLWADMFHGNEEMVREKKGNLRPFEKQCRIYLFSFVFFVFYHGKSWSEELGVF